MAICDANYQFTMVDIGDSGRNSDGGVFSYHLSIPDPERLPGSPKAKCYPNVLVADEAFQLQQNVMKPYPTEVLLLPERIFNYILSRARRIIENTFGIAAARFRVFRRPIQARVEMVVQITKAVVLHNFLMAGRSFQQGTRYCPIGFIDIFNNELTKMFRTIIYIIFSTIKFFI